MKTIKSLLAASVLTLVFTLSAAGQQYGPQLDITPALTNDSVVTVTGVTTTNLTAGQKKTIWLSDKGFSLSTLIGATNSVTTTNCTFRLEFSVDGTNYWQQFSAVFAPNGTTGAPNGTNFDATLTRNYRYARVYSIQNTNLASVFLTNLNFAVRQ